MGLFSNHCSCFPQSGIWPITYVSYLLTLQGNWVNHQELLEMSSRVVLSATGWFKWSTKRWQICKDLKNTKAFQSPTFYILFGRIQLELVVAIFTWYPWPSYEIFMFCSGKLWKWSPRNCSDSLLLSGIVLLGVVHLSEIQWHLWLFSIELKLLRCSCVFCHFLRQAHF